MNKKCMFGFLVLVCIALTFIMPDKIATHDRLALDMSQALIGPTRAHIMGTDRLGRDIFSRIIYGTRTTCSAALIIVGISFCIGTLIGCISGYFGGIMDALIMRLVDMMTAFPNYVLSIALAGMMGPSLRNVIIAMCITSWMGFARMSRGLVISARERGYIASCRALGGGRMYNIVHHIFPDVLFPMITYASIHIGGVILSIVALCYLGMGVTPPEAELGSMINEANQFIADAPHMFIFPGLAIVFIVIGFQMMGDGLRDYWNPKQRGLAQNG